MNSITPLPENFNTLTPALLELAHAIRDRAAKTSYQIGCDLAEAKLQCGHGDWLPFLAEAGLQERTAQRLMQYARAVNADPALDPKKSLPPVSAVLGKSDNLSDLSDGPRVPPEYLEGRAVIEAKMAEIRELDRKLKILADDEAELKKENAVLKRRLKNAEADLEAKRFKYNELAARVHN